MQDDQMFCPKCGQAAGNAPVSQNKYPPQYPFQPPAPYQPPNPQYAAPRKKGAGLILFSIIALILTAGIVAAVFLLGPIDAKPSQLNGEWDAVVTAEKIINDKTDYISSSDLGKENNMQMVLKLNDDGKGTMIMNSTEFNVAYKNGKIVAESSSGDIVRLHFEGTFKKGKDGYAIEGSWKYSILSGSDKGDLAEGSWKAALATPAAVQPTSSAPPATKSTGPAATNKISASSLEGIWIGTMTPTEIPGLAANTALSDADRQTITDSLGVAIDTGFVFKNGKVWVGSSSDVNDPTESNMGVVSFSGNSFSANVETINGKAHIQGTLANDSGKLKITGTISFEALPYSSDINIALVAAFEADKQ